MRASLLLYPLLVLLISFSAASAPRVGDGLFIDALVFMEDDSTTPRLDVIITLPHSSISFERHSGATVGIYHSRV